MAFLGNSSSSANYVPQTDFFSGNGSTVAFTLSRAVVSAYQVEAVVANVIQNPSDAYTINGNIITFTSAPPAGTNNVYVRYAALNTTLLQPGQGTVAADQIAAGAVVASKLGTGAAVANIGSRAIAGSQLPAGTVLQVVQGSTTTYASTTSATPVSTGLTASITPTSATSKILISITAQGTGKGGSTTALSEAFYLYKNGSNLSILTDVHGYTGTAISNEMSFAANYLDTPATTSATTYTLYYCSTVSGYGVYFNNYMVTAGTANSTITLMEIAA